MADDIEESQEKGLVVLPQVKCVIYKVFHCANANFQADPEVAHLQIS